MGRTVPIRQGPDVRYGLPAPGVSLVNAFSWLRGHLGMEEEVNRHPILVRQPEEGPARHDPGEDHRLNDC